MELREGNTLRRSEGLLQAGKRDEARRLLISYIKRVPDSADAWWLLSQAVETDSQKKDCLKRVLRFEPDHILALTHLDLLENPPVSVKKPVPVYPFAQRKLPPATHQPSVETSPSQTLSSAFSPEDQEHAPKASSRKKKSSSVRSSKKGVGKGWVISVILFLLLGLLAVLYFAYRVYAATVPQSNAALAETAVPRQALSLPSTWTPTPSPLPLSTYTPFPTLEPTHTPVPMSTYTKLPRITGVAVGQYVPDFTLKNLDGQKVSLSDYAGKPIVMIFWATWCPYCEEEVSALKSVYQDYQSQGLVVLAVNSGDSASEVKKYQASHQITYPILLDSNKKVSRTFQVVGVPFYYLINADGKIIYAASGMFGQAALENNVRILLSDNLP